MKKLILLLSILSIHSVAMFAQKIGYVKVETIMERIPEYVAAQSQIESMVQLYNDIIAKDLEKIEVKYKNYQQNKSRMTQSQRDIAETEIISDEKALKERQSKYFGEDGEVTIKSKELLDPVVNRVNAAIEEYAKRNGYSFIFDIDALSGVMYYNQTEDLSAEIIKLLNK